jgi:signal peptidase I
MESTEPAIIGTPPTPPQAKPRANTGGVKDTIESILVAFILAFVFRAFVVEAFVIPTGSMATTLLGAHTRFQCPDCGYSFDVNFQPTGNAQETDDPPIPPTAGPITSPVFCPNCGFKMPQSQTEDPPVFYGDRLLVLKYLYLLQKPQRWDVVVFKAPTQMTVNYIKRLIATPGESIMVLDGDIYIKQPGSDKFVVQTKPQKAQDALWRLVYDNDFHPQLSLQEPSKAMSRAPVGDWTQPWTVVDGTGWTLNDPATHGRTFSFKGDAQSSTLRFNLNANPTAQNLNDYLTYDQQPHPSPPTINVSDVDLRLTYQRTAGDGPLELLLTKRGRSFVAQISPNQAALFEERNGSRTAIGSPMALAPSEHPLRLEFSNADYQVTLRADDKVVAQTTPAEYAPDIPALIEEFHAYGKAPAPRIEITASHQQSKISHLSLWRDVYYYNRDQNVRRATPDDPVTLGKDEYFTMGDNSILSYDARCWPTGVHLPAEDLDVDAGRVPGRFLLGKAFYVYWPAGYLANPSLPAFVPNFGAMRFIH